MSINEARTEADSALETTDGASIDVWDRELTVVDDAGELAAPVALGIEVDRVGGERRAGLSGIPSLGTAARYADLLTVVGAMGIESAVGDAVGEVGTLYYDPDARAVACELDADGAP